MKTGKIIVTFILICVSMSWNVYGNNLDVQFERVSDRTPAASIIFCGPDDGGIGILGVADEKDDDTRRTTRNGVGVWGAGLNYDSTGVLGTGKKYGVRGITDGTTLNSSGLNGYANAYRSSACGVVGMSNGNEGTGVYGTAPKYGVRGVSNRIGVYGETTNPSGYGVVSKGNMKVEGNLEVSGNLTLLRSSNLAFSATATASSELNSNYSALKVKDGIIGQVDSGCWSTNGENVNAWVQLRWSSPATFNKVIIYGIGYTLSHITRAELLIYQDADNYPEYTIYIGGIPIDGAPKVVTLRQEQGTNIRRIRIRIGDVDDTIPNQGLSEIECQYDPDLWKLHLTTIDTSVVENVRNGLSR